ncbi:MAG: hypothetical protein ACI86X_001611 [Moritella sp.]|jgi:hypothetical protein
MTASLARNKNGTYLHMCHFYFQLDNLAYLIRLDLFEQLIVSGENCFSVSF